MRSDKEVDKEWKATLRHLITYMIEDPRTISRAMAFELADTAPTVRGLRRNLLAISKCSRRLSDMFFSFHSDI